MTALLYVGAYLLLIEPIDMFPTMTTIDRSVYTVRAHHYRVQHPAIREVFRPMEYVDRKVRPEFWALRKLPHEERQRLLRGSSAADGGKFLRTNR